MKGNFLVRIPGSLSLSDFTDALYSSLSPTLHVQTLNISECRNNLIHAYTLFLSCYETRDTLGHRDKGFNRDKGFIRDKGFNQDNAI